MQTNSVIIASAVDRCSFPIKQGMDIVRHHTQRDTEREREKELNPGNVPEGQGRSAAHPVSVNGCYPWGQERSAAHLG